MNEDSRAQLVSTIYDMAAGTGSYSDVLRVIGRNLRSHYGGVITTTADRIKPRSLGTLGITGQDHREFLHVWHKGNIYGQRGPTRAAGVVIESRAIVPQHEFTRTDIYNRYFRHIDFGEGLRLDILHESGGLSECMSLGRNLKTGPYTEPELRFARFAMPHLQCAAILARRLRHAELMSSAAFAALDALHACVMILDRDGRLIHATAAAAALLRNADGLASSGQGLAAAIPAESTRLSALLARAAGVAGHPPVSGALRLTRPSLQPPLALIAMPLPLASEMAGFGPAVLLHVADPLAEVGAGPRELVGLFGLTSAEADLAAQLLKGMDASEVAQQSGRRLSTVRTHIANLMAKVHVKRQTDLVRLLTRLPRAPEIGRRPS